MILDSTLRSLQVFYETTHTTTEPDFSAFWSDTAAGSSFVPGATTAATNGSTPVTLVPSPAAATQRQVKDILVYNGDSVPHTFTIQYNDNGTARILKTALVVNGETLFYSPDSGWKIGASTNVGTVTSVALSAPVEFTVSGSPVTSSGTLTLTKATETANTVWAGPTSGGAVVPTFRALVSTDIPSLGANPTATAGPTAVNGSANTYMRSDGAPAIQLGTAAQKGLVQVDGTTITASAGVITAVSPGGFTGLANPTASVGLTAVNGTATTAIRSDGAPALSQSISPTWSGNHTFSNPVVLPLGSAANPSFEINTNYGLYYDSTNTALGVTVAGSEVGWFGPAGTVLSHAGGPYSFTVQSEGSGPIAVSRYTTDTAAAQLMMNKARGTIASPTVPVNGDGIGNQIYNMWTGAAFTQGAQMQGVCVETSTVDTTHLGSQLRFRMCPIGSGTITEVLRIANESGLSMFGANPVIDQNRTHILNTSTVAGLPTNVTGGLRYVSNLEGGQGVTYGGTSVFRNISNGQVASSTVTGAGVLSEFTGYFNFKQRALVNNVMQMLSDFGLLTKITGLWVHALPTNSTDALMNWITPGTNNLTIVGSPTWTANQGFTGDGTTSLLNTGVSQAVFGQSNGVASIGTYVRTSSAALKAVIGMGNVAQNRNFYLPSFTSGSFNTRCQDLTNDAWTPSQFTGMFVMTRLSTTQFNDSVNDAAATTITRNTAGGVTNTLAFLGTTDTTGSEFSTAQLSFSFMGTNLTTTDIANLRWTLVDNFLVGIGAVAADYTVATLPLAGTPPKGSRVFVTDALTPVFASTLTGGSTTYTPVYTDNTNWRAG